ncbi:MAG: hypothetical protein CMD18_07455 [Flavobacteriales bacterium]|nr:hypothetical protein [Flavobacteriales bacterium]|tara:strand:+ start:1434 stop:2123 length:690 start_codon:yes stop_codon:yes gene_type:complete
MKKVIFLFLLFSNFALFSGGGYLGKVHNFGLNCSYNPIEGGLNLTLNNLFDETLPGSAMSFRPFYEISLNKGVSISSDIGFHNVAYGYIEEESNLYSEYIGRFYFSGFDFKTSLRFYGYRNKGKIAPLGKYNGIMLRLPFVKKYLSADTYINHPMFFLGFEKGVQKIIYNNISLDLGFNLSLSTHAIRYLYWTMIYDSELDLDPDETSISSYNTIENTFNIYFKIGFLR